MTNLMRVNVELTGWEGAPGINSFWFSQGTLSNVDAAMAQVCVDEVRAAYQAARGCYRPGFIATVLPECNIIDVESGELIDVAVAATPPAAVTSSSGASSASTAVMACVNFKSDTFRHGRLVRARSFQGPLAGDQIQSNGKINVATASAFESAFTAMSSGVGPRLAVYTRPAPINDNVGLWADVVIVKTAPLPAILKSRRD